MNIIEWFSPDNIEHIKAFKHLCQTGMWPKDFVPEGMDLPNLWHVGIANKLAMRWVEHITATPATSEKEPFQDSYTLQVRNNRTLFYCAIDIIERAKIKIVDIGHADLLLAFESSADRSLAIVALNKSTLFRRSDYFIN